VSSVVSAELGERFPDVAALMAALDETGYLAGDQLAAALFLAVRMGQPILLEGEPGVGKTEAAKALATALETVLVRLQCYEGIAAAEALYEWNYPRQLLAIRLAEASHERVTDTDLFREEYLLARPLLTALDHPGPRPAVLLIDEVDRADDEFEAFLFEMLAESSVTIPELGTRRAVIPPVAVLTSNRTRDLHDALKRRCLYHWIAYPDAARVAQIIRRRVPAASSHLAGEVATAVNRLRGMDLTKPPGISEAITWASALAVFGAGTLSADAAGQTMSVVIKYPEDEQTVREAGLASVVGHD
jgi:MoxR-like ATPase